MDGCVADMTSRSVSRQDQSSADGDWRVALQPSLLRPYAPPIWSKKALKSVVRSHVGASHTLGGRCRALTQTQFISHLDKVQHTHTRTHTLTHSHTADGWHPLQSVAGRSKKEESTETADTNS